jgi:hypothetical protein
MNLKKIIKESLDEFDWIRDTEPSSPHVPYSGMKFKIKDAEETSGVIYTISDITDTHMIINWIDPSDGEYRENFRWPLKHYFGFVDNGDVEIVYENLNESENDFAWINDFEQPEIKFKKGERVRIHNIGDKDAFINWLGMYGNRYLNGDFGKNIEGVVLVDEFSLTGEFSIVNVTGGRTHDEIYFPYQTKMESLNDKHQYTGLNLIYELI